MEEQLVAIKTIEQVDVAGRRILMRVDFNVPLKSGAITDDRRIREAVPTILSVLERGGKIILVSHLGRPAGTGYEAGFSLKPAAKRLSELLGSPVGFPSTDCIDGASAAAVNTMNSGDVLLLENLRFHKEEKSGDPGFARTLAGFGEIYCNDAFGTSHRADASMVAVPKEIAAGFRVAGLLLKREIAYLSEALETPARPFTAVLGGAKVSDKIKAVEHFLSHADRVLIGGAMAYTFLQAMGKSVGESRIETDQVDVAKRLLERAAIEKCELHLPQDHVCSTEFAESTGDIEVFEDEIQPGFMGLDIGPETQSSYTSFIEHSKTVVWAGPMGVFEWRPFRIGSQEIASAMAEATKNGAVTIVAGGDTAAAAQQFGAADKVTHVSTGGGASLSMLAHDPMPGIDILDKA